MYPSYTLLALIAVSRVSAVPLNINLGAYSPALVVGDGEISFGGGAENGGAKSAAQLMETLATGAVSAAQAGGEANAKVITPEGAKEAVKVEALPPKPAEGGEQPAAAEGGEAEKPATNNIRFRELARPAVERREATDADAAVSIAQLEERSEKLQRDLAGFREALNFATNAMKNTPKIELGTEKSGVGIIQNPGINVPVGSAAAGAGPEKRSVKKEKRGVTLIAITDMDV